MDAASRGPCVPLHWLVSPHAAPLLPRSDHGPGLVSHAVLEGIARRWAIHASAWQFEAADRVNRPLPDECRSLEWFGSRRAA